MMGKRTRQVHVAQSKAEDETKKAGLPGSQEWQGRGRETPRALCACGTPLSIPRGRTKSLTHIYLLSLCNPKDS